MYFFIIPQYVVNRKSNIFKCPAPKVIAVSITKLGESFYRSMAYQFGSWDPLNEVTQNRKVEPARFSSKLAPLNNNSLDEYFNEMDTRSSIKKYPRDLNPLTDVEIFCAPNTPIDKIRRTPNSQLGRVQVYGLASKHSFRGSIPGTNSAKVEPPSQPKPTVRKIGTPKKGKTAMNIYQTADMATAVVPSTSKRPRPKLKKGIAKDMLRFVDMHVPLYDIVIVDRKVSQLVSNRGLSQTHLRRLQFCFDSIDVDGSGHVDIPEILERIETKQSPFTDELFVSFLDDRNSEGTVNFEEFVYVFVSYCMNTKDDILKFCFETFDQDGNDLISEKEYVEMMKCVNGHEDGPMFPGNYRTAMRRFDTNKDGSLSYEEFSAFEAQYPMVLYPAFSIQDKMQKWTLGEEAWRLLMADYARNLEIVKYKLDHDGKLPKDTPMKQMNTFFSKFLKF